MPGVACRTYAPVGGHHDLLAYLVRRLLENGANSSFVSVAADPDVPVADLLVRPQAIVGCAGTARHPRMPLPADIYRPVARELARRRVRRPAALARCWRRSRARRCRRSRRAPLVDGRDARRGPTA